MAAPTSFALDPVLIGLPTRNELVEMRIWDMHYHGLDEQDDLMPYIERMGVERLVSLDIARVSSSEADIAANLALLEKWKHNTSGIIRIDPSDPEKSLDLMNRLIRNGPCIGIKYSGGNPGGLTCDHPNNDPLIRLARDLGAVIYIHTWIKVGDDPRYPGGGNNPGESTPMDVARLAQRFPDVPMVCGHSGGDWELGIRAIRARPNVLFEFSGGDSWNGVGDFAHRELGADRLVWGSHAPSRSFATEFTKIYGSGMSKADMKKAFGTNLRRLAAGILKAKGNPIEV